MPDTISRLRDSNQQAGAVWGAGGTDYDDVSFVISGALLHAAQRLSAKAGDRVLDVATGTGWTARNVARTGARVTGVDIAPALIEAARELAAHIQPRIDYQVAEVEALPFGDGAFDGVISTFGVMFAGDHAAAASELGRVCRHGGKLCLATWTPDGSVSRFFAALGAHGTTPPPEPSPLLWGDPSYLTTLLGRDFDLKFETGVSSAYHDSAEDVWAWYLRGFGPLRMLHDSLDAAGKAALKRDVDAYHNHYAVEAGLHIQREYLVTIGRRR